MKNDAETELAERVLKLLRDEPFLKRVTLDDVTRDPQLRLFMCRVEHVVALAHAILDTHTKPNDDALNALDAERARDALLDRVRWLKTDQWFKAPELRMSGEEVIAWVLKEALRGEP